MQAKSFAEGTCVQSKLRGNFDIREKWVQELRDSQKLQVAYIHTTNNLADLMTNVHSTARFEQLLNMTKHVVKQAYRIQQSVTVAMSAILAYATAM